MSKQLITVGNIYFDHTIFGVDLCGHNSIQPGYEYSAESGEIVVGGSAVNVALQGVALGMNVSFVGKVGDDESGREVRRLLEEKDIVPNLIVSSDDSTSIAVNFVIKDGADFVGAHYGMAAKNLSMSDFNLESSLFSGGGLIYFGGTAKQEKLFNQLPELFSALKSKGFTIFFDPNRFPAGKENSSSDKIINALPYVDYYMPNNTEIMQFANCDSIDDAIDFAMSKGAKNVIVKNGPKGCLVRNNDVNQVVEGIEVTPITTVGAGDCFNAAFISQIAKGVSPLDGAIFANKCASIKVSQNIWPTENNIV